MSGPSLRRRLMAILCGAVALAWLATAAFTYFDTRRLIDTVIDAHLEESALVLLGAIEGAAADPRPLSTDPDRPLSFRILAELPAGQPPGFSDRAEGDRHWRVFAVRGGAGRWVEVAVRQEVRAGFASRVAAHVLHPLWVAVPLLAALIWGALRWGLGPLDRVAATVAGRAPADLEPLPDRDAPREIRPLVQALNGLFARMAVLRERDRRFAADAAHELRTPLAVIRTHAEVALAARDAGERQQALDDVLAGTDRATRLVGQLLALARIDGAELAGRAARVDLAGILRAEAAEFGDEAAARGIGLILDPGEPGRGALDGHAELLAVLVRNLLDNALCHTPKGGSVRLALEHGAGRMRLLVDDTGPGIPPDLRDRVRDRFFRARPSGTGAGLGLSIAEAIAGLHGGTLELTDRPGGPGLRAIVDLPSERPMTGSSPRTPAR
jgi:two-component system sensor histidine kinase QseC